ncbi:hypothetical protein OE88DRAFT_1505084 [Heliocybe sulcata]|uniref:Uncharacterized protein n=1 Tax=Heliocybe sulcata TaxID=5364 RepID=A0A5C3N2Z2_9AGAM|nr:hypothetical protein OE88DRAFT_1505084 [Heliocybe sulcata]
MTCSTMFESNPVEDGLSRRWPSETRGNVLRPCCATLQQRRRRELWTSPRRVDGALHVCGHKVHNYCLYIRGNEVSYGNVCGFASTGLACPVGETLRLPSRRDFADCMLLRTIDFVPLDDLVGTDDSWGVASSGLPWCCPCFTLMLVAGRL